MRADAEVAGNRRASYYNRRSAWPCMHLATGGTLMVCAIFYPRDAMSLYDAAWAIRESMKVCDEAACRRCRVGRMELYPFVTVTHSTESR
jgi:hypothetical protein